MFKSRRQKCEEEAKKDPIYTPTKDLKIDESQLSDEQKAELAPKGIPWIPIIVIGTIVILMVICIVVIMASGGPIVGTSS